MSMRTIKETETNRTDVFFSTLKASFLMFPVMFQFQNGLCFLSISWDDIKSILVSLFDIKLTKGSCTIMCVCVLC